MGSRRSKEAAELKKSQPRNLRFFRCFCSPVADAVAPHTPPAASARATDATTAPPRSDTLEKLPQAEADDLVTPFRAETSSPPDIAQSAVASATMSSGAPSRMREEPAWASSPLRALQLSTQYVERRSSICTTLPDSEAASPPCRLSRVTQLSSAPSTPSRQYQQYQQQLSSSPAMRTRMPLSFSPLLSPRHYYANTPYSCEQDLPQLRALPVPDSRLLVFNTQMAGTLPMLVNGATQHNFISLHADHDVTATTDATDRFASNGRAFPLALRPPPNMPSSATEAAATRSSPMRPRPPHSRSASSFSSASRSLHSGSLISSSSVASLIDQDPMEGGTKRAPLTEHGFATWQNSSTTMAPPDAAKSSPQPRDGVSPNPVGASILMPRRPSSHGSVDTTLGSTSLVSARYHKSSRETEGSKEVETVTDFVARMKSAKTRAEGDSGDRGGGTPDSAELIDGGGGGSGETAGWASRRGSGKLDSAGRAAVTVSVPPPPPLRMSSDSGGWTRPHRHPPSLNSSADVPSQLSSPEPLPTLPRPISNTSISLPSPPSNDHDATSNGSGRSNTSHRRRDVKASVEAVLAHMSSSSAPSPSAASRRKRRDMAVNFLFSP
ncbi:hypothetical protein ABB37_09177 [Leptomonas pyrrhocoris]|uniref:Uncharacterized protein n=1 Tax=Leptomonas pyrrhocoris TaxID=157538 RepID=A0A0N0DRC7_LEPPY|nr:hypothetical protein ABB37_09177 [Leptomonas pyrrhocoris]KPA74518.1 hypothetical protein ABB37_09177 [Leptomonas pyrrhocoris]|eukprot:XP_015652957.1 hypothetical protein ABB37_09177 [Leptomonas pyrrhocoris]